MSKKVYNFSAGPATLPPVLMAQIKEEFTDYRGLGASIIEVSHRSPEFLEIIENIHQRFRRLTQLPDSHHLAFIPGGARMLFSAIPLNILGAGPSHKAQYVVSGVFAALAAKEAEKYGTIDILASGEPYEFREIPAVERGNIDENSSYIHVTSNNTIYGTSWKSLPATGKIPLVVDATSDMLAHKLDYSKLGAVYAGLQKNLGPSGLALLVIKKDLLNHAHDLTPSLLNFTEQIKNNSLINTINTFAVYVLGLILKWIEDEGGIDSLESRNNHKAKILYKIIDSTDFYIGYAKKECRSPMNVTFNLKSSQDEARFLEEAVKNGLIALKGHRALGGIRASIYNGMSLEGVEALGDFMKEFEKRYG